MGTNLRGLIDVLRNDMAPNAGNTYACIIAASFFLYIGVMCMFIVTLRKKITEDGSNENQEKPGDVEMGKIN